jgi:hypothetical protein
MSRQYFDDSHQPLRRRVTIQPDQSLNSSSRRNVPLASRDFAFQPTFQPDRERNRAAPPPPSQHYHEKYSHSNEYPNSTRSSSIRMNVSQRFLLIKHMFNVLNY